jgi:tetratricopeptide (TPR) repeat protein
MDLSYLSLAARRGVVVSAVLGCASCTSPTVVQQSETPRSREVPGQGVYQWEQKSGWVRPNRGSLGTPQQVRTESRKAFDAAAYADALDGFLTYKKLIAVDDPTIAETNFLIAECYYYLGNYEKAIDGYREVYQKNKPENEILRKSFQRINDIALDYLHERAVCSFIGISYNCPSHGIELLVGENGLIFEYPNLSFADDSIYEIGKYYFETKQYAEAVPIYERLVHDYPQSEWRGVSEYYLALSVFKQIRGADYDEKLIEDAEKKFELYLENNPRGPQAEDAREKRREISEMLGRKNLNLAKFYLRESEAVSAKIYLRLVLDKYTTSTAAREAREIQRELEKN